MPWPRAGSGADSWDCLSGGAQCLSSIRQRPEQGIVVGPDRVTKPRPPRGAERFLGHRHRRCCWGCGDRAPGICACSASVTPVRLQLSPSLQLPNPFGFVVGFYFYFLVIFFFSPHAQEQRTVSETCVPHAWLFPLHPWSSMVPPSSARPPAGLPPPLILHKCQSCHAVLAGDSPLLWVGVWAGTETPVQIALALQLSTSACPRPGKARSSPSKAPSPAVPGCVWIFGLALLDQGGCSQSTVPG